VSRSTQAAATATIKTSRRLARPILANLTCQINSEAHEESSYPSPTHANTIDTHLRPVRQEPHQARPKKRRPMRSCERARLRSIADSPSSSSWSLPQRHEESPVELRRTRHLSALLLPLGPKKMRMTAMPWHHMLPGQILRRTCVFFNFAKPIRWKEDGPMTNTLRVPALVAGAMLPTRFRSAHTPGRKTPPPP